MKTNMPKIFMDKYKEYSIGYKLKYGKQMTYWVESATASEYISARNFEFDYFLNVQDQTVYADIEFRSRRVKNGKSEYAENSKVDFENEPSIQQTDGNFVQLEIKGQFNIHDLLLKKGSYEEPNIIDDSIFENYVNNDGQDLKEMNRLSPLMMSIQECKPTNAKKIRFRIEGRFSTKQPWKVIIHEIVSNSTK